MYTKVIRYSATYTHNVLSRHLCQSAVYWALQSAYDNAELDRLIAYEHATFVN